MSTRYTLPLQFYAPGGVTDLRSKSYLFLLLVLGLGILSGFLFTRTKPNYGLDVRGGIRLTYQMQLNKEQRVQVDDIRQRLIHILGVRAGGDLGVAEAPISSKGDDEIVVELPGQTDLDKAEKIIGTSAKIQFYWAKNVVTENAPYRRYRSVDDKTTADPQVNFESAYAGSTGAPIKPENPEYAQIIKGWELILEGEELKSAGSRINGTKEEPEMTFSSQGANKMRTWSQRHENQREAIAAVLDGKVLSLAFVENGTILSDNAVITGPGFTHAYVKTLADLLNGGALPVDLKKLSSEKIDPTIGASSLTQMITAGVIAFGLIAAFLLVYYSFPGVVALIALGLYILFSLTVLMLTGATFSLAGIAGFILSVGMAVDANILVFERLKEEIKSGKSLQASIELGFRRALPAIIDSNACTILTSLVLVNLGTGPVKGFATTLIIGVLISLFTAVTVTRSLLMFFVGSGIGDHQSWYAVNRNWFGKKFDPMAAEPLLVVQKAKKWFAISIATILISIPFFFMGGFKLNVEFRGGFESGYTIASPIDANQIVANLEKAGYKGGNIKLGTGKAGRLAFITVPTDDRLKVTNQTDAQRQELIAEAAGLPKDAKPLTFSFVGPEVQKETLQNAIMGVTLSSLLIVLYLAIRFGTGFGGFAPGLRFGVSAIGALLHDILVVIGTAAIVGFIFKWEVSALFLTAMLTIIGFSVHDTIVIFDRIRENLRRPKPGEDFSHLVNRSITQSFARSINTSMTVIVTLMILVFFGTPTPDLKFFVLAMMIGIISGTYSSIYNASPILCLWDKAIEKKKGHEHTLLGMSNAEMLRHQVVTTRISEPEVVSDSGRTYGQVRRRANQQKPGHIEVEDDI